MAILGRLALRVEGQNWNAYYASPDTMEDAIWLGSIAMRFVEDQARKDIFMALMQEAMSDLIEEITGVRPTWPNSPRPAPEHERSGSA